VKFHGKQVALENDICLCKCDPPPRLIASQRTASMSFNTGELTAMGFKADGRPIPKDTGAFDEQVRAAGRGVSNGYPYFIRAADGRTMQGRLDASGTLPRVFTDGVEDYHVYWGDDALAQQLDSTV
jgi:hypothetical protein